MARLQDKVSSMLGLKEGGGQQAGAEQIQPGGMGMTGAQQTGTLLPNQQAVIKYKCVNAAGLNVFYREAGNPGAPAVLLLHGFPTSSHMFRNLIPLLAGEYHVVAPDLPGFGFTESKPHSDFNYTFDNLSRVIEAFVVQVGLQRFAMYIFDYGAPVGLRLALRRPDLISAIVSQNGNAYLEGLGEAWKPIQQYWRDPSPASRDALRAFLSPAATKSQYTHGVTDASLIAPESYTLDSALLARPGNDEIQLDLLLDYASNVALYPSFQQYLRTAKPPLLALWGQNDPFFVPAGAMAFLRDIPGAKVRLLDTGHFALETHALEIGIEMQQFFRGLSGVPKT